MDSTGRLPKADGRWLAEQLTKAMTLLKVAGVVGARVVSDAEMAEAHQRWSGVSGTTDVLTFDLSDSPATGGAPAHADSPPNVAADVLICLDQAERQAKVRGHSARDELLLYLVHALLHCMGHDDHDEPAATRMHAEEDRLLLALGVGAVYARPEGRA